MRHHSGVLTWLHLVSAQQILTTGMAHIVVDKSKDNAKPRSICVFTTLSTLKKMYFSERDILTRAALSGLLIDDGKLANC